MSLPINPGDWLDSRDVIARWEYLKESLRDLDFFDPEEDDPEDIEFARSLIKDEMTMLKELIDEGEELSDWEYGVTLIPDADFVRYAEELADDIGAIDRDCSWPLNFIDWDAAANALKMDYTEIRWQGVSYWAR